MNRRLYDALEPGGHLVVVDHAAKAGTGTSVAKTLHRADARDVSSGDGRILTDKFALRFVKPKP